MGILKIITTILSFILNLFSPCCSCIEPDTVKGCIGKVGEVVHDCTGDAKDL